MEYDIFDDLLYEENVDDFFTLDPTEQVRECSFRYTLKYDRFKKY